MAEPLKQVNISDFEVGQSLPGDIVDGQEKILFRQGLKLTKDILAAWQRRGDGPFFLRAGEADATPSGSEGNHQTTSGVAQTHNKVQLWVKEAVSQLDSLVANVLNDQQPTLFQIEALIDSYLVLLKQNPPAVSQCILYNELDEANGENQAVRCVFLSALAGVLAQSHGLSDDECATTCLAAMLHDLALFPGLLDKIQESFDSDEDRQSVVTRHGHFSSDLLSARTGVPQLVRIVMQQVHEQMDGSGYPRGIPGHVINVMARLINLVDAFLTLIAAGSGRRGYIPADAMAYLVYHTSRGAFDRDAMMAFVKSQTMYGIGTRVLLDDGRQATVMSSVAHSPLRPVVQCDSADDQDDAQIIDLSATEIQIAEPLVDQRFAHRTRMPKSQMQAILWQTLADEQASEPLGQAADLSAARR